MLYRLLDAAQPDTLPAKPVSEPIGTRHLYDSDE